MFEVLKYLFSTQRSSRLSQLIKEDAFLVDVRSPEEFASGHARSSVNIPLDKIPEQLHRFKDKQNIIVFCKSGMRSRQAKALLEQNGIVNVTNAGSWENINRIINSNT
ncbi:rhodanese-like domain-containing protein [Flavobacterium sp.]|uniref:rhodanese-like domain-containing protein n=1 Tax=Flavobacterium sp. TaxID=239 RepID=UPI002611D398|nr:rhodanese-like domain-containing protein [Flavobacterium sp.]